MTDPSRPAAVLPSVLRCLLLFFVAGVVMAQEQGPRAPRYHATKAWRGSLVATGKPDPVRTAELLGVLAEKGVRAQVDYTVYLEVDFELTEMETEPWVWRGRVTRSRYESGYRATLRTKESTHEAEFETNGPLDFSSDSEARLHFHHDDTWSVRLPTGMRNTELRECTTDDKGGVFRRSSTGPCFGIRSTPGHAFKPTGATLHQTGTQPSMFQGVTAPLAPPMLWDYALYLEPLAWAELHLEIETPADYATWMPTTTVAAEAGRPLVVTARLVDKNGGEPKVRVSSFEWKLLQTSREPGVALNWPLDAKDTRCDLELGADGGIFELRNENQELERAVQSGHSDTVKVVPHDWGAWSTLQVTAVTADGFRIRGKLKGAEEFGLRVPKRAADSKIAEAWRQRTGCSADALDDDDKPVGDGNLGDGFSNYEEYRGFVMGGGHFRGKPKQKDVFVRNQVGRKLLPGIYKFSDITGLSVRYELREGEMPETRVMNGNRSSQSPRSSEAPQHGLILDIVDGGNYSFAVPVDEDSVMRPGNCQLVQINWELLEPDEADQLAVTVAHELSHACGVAHHGEKDGNVVWLRKQSDVDGKREVWFEERPTRRINGQDVFPGTPGPRIRVFDVAGREIVAGAGDFLAKPQVLCVGHHGQQHSGDVACVMRYFVAEAFVLPGRPNDRFLSPGEPRGTGLCERAAGTQFNAAPTVRYGNATCGGCRHQLCVRDDAPARAR